MSLNRHDRQRSAVRLITRDDVRDFFGTRRPRLAGCSGRAGYPAYCGQSYPAEDPGRIPSILAGLGLAWLVRGAPWKAAIVAATPVLLYLLVGRYRAFFPRNIVAVAPFVSILSGAFVFLAYQESQKRLRLMSKSSRVVVTNLALVAVLSAAVWPQAISAIRHIEKINLPDTRWESMQWIEENLPAGSRIGREHYTPPIEKYSSKFDAHYLGNLRQPTTRRHSIAWTI